MPGIYKSKYFLSSFLFYLFGFLLWPNSESKKKKINCMTIYNILIVTLSSGDRIVHFHPIELKDSHVTFFGQLNVSRGHKGSLLARNL